MPVTVKIGPTSFHWTKEIGMENIRITHDELLEILKLNRSEHEAEFKSAHKKWRKKATKRLRKVAEQAESGGHIEETPLADLPRPTSYLGSYDKAIRRVELDTRNEIELDDRTFSAWVEDEWNWRGMFAATSSLYNG